MADERAVARGRAGQRQRAPARQGAIVEAVRLLSDAGVGVEDLALRRPTLDDVFLALTGPRDAEDGERRRRSGAA